MVQLLKNVFAWEVPRGTTSLAIVQDSGGTCSLLQGHLIGSGSLKLDGSYEILFTTKSCTEDDASSVRNAVVDAHFDTELQEWRYGFHENNTMIYENATDALQSILRSHGLSTDKNYLLLKRIDL